LRKTWLAISLALLAGACATSGANKLAAKQPPVAKRSDSESESLALVAQAQMRLEIGEITKGLELFRRAVDLRPADGGLKEEYGLALASSGLPDQARSELSQVESLSPSGEATLGILMAQAADNAADLAKAIPHLEAGLDAVPTGQQCRFILAQSLVKLGRGKEAFEQLKPLLEERPDDARLLLLAGQAERQADRLDDAIDYLKRAAEDPDARGRANLELVETLAAAGKYGDAADLMGQFIKKNGGTLSTMTRWATLLLRAGNEKKASSVLDDVLAKDANFREAVLLKALIEASDGHLESAEQLYRRALAANKEDGDAALGLARLLTDERRLTEARSLLDGVWKQIESAKLENDPAAVQVAQERATIELIDRAPGAAEPWLHRLEVAPLSRRSLALWGEYFRQREAWAKGVEWLEKAQFVDAPEVSRARSAFLAEFHLAAGDEKAGSEIVDKLLAGDADDVVAALGALERRKEYRAVVQDATRALDRFPDSSTIRFALAASLERSGQWDKSVEQFRLLLAKTPDDAGSLNYLGYMFADRGVHLQEAKELITKAVNQDPTSGAFKDSLGWVYFKLGELEPAEKYLTEAARLDPNDATVQEHLGDLRRTLGDQLEAARAYRRALALGPDEEGQKERIENKLASMGGNANP
jgi:tetratricopeptide (TPR) repeat protein